MKSARPTSKRAKTEATLAKYEAMNPDELDANQRSFRELAIRALRIELTLQDKGFVEEDGWMVPAATTGAERSPRPTVPRKIRNRRPIRSR